MLKRLSVVGLSAFALTGLFAAPASAGSACASVSVTVNGEQVVNEAHCADLP